MTKEEIMKIVSTTVQAAAFCSVATGCYGCPFESEPERNCTKTFANFIKITNPENKTTKKEPAPAPTETSSVINDDNINSLCDKNNTKTTESQALESVKQKLLAIYETLTPEEIRAWDLGEVYAETVRGISGGEYNG